MTQKSKRIELLEKYNKKCKLKLSVFEYFYVQIGQYVIRKLISNSKNQLKNAFVTNSWPY